MIHYEYYLDILLLQLMIFKLYQIIFCLLYYIYILLIKL
jgi:hypothetical protein